MTIKDKDRILYWPELQSYDTKIKEHIDSADAEVSQQIIDTKAELVESIAQGDTATLAEAKEYVDNKKTDTKQIKGKLPSLHITRVEVTPSSESETTIRVSFALYKITADTTWSSNQVGFSPYGASGSASVSYFNVTKTNNLVDYGSFTLTTDYTGTLHLASIYLKLMIKTPMESGDTVNYSFLELYDEYIIEDWEEGDSNTLATAKAYTDTKIAKIPGSVSLEITMIDIDNGDIQANLYGDEGKEYSVDIFAYCEGNTSSTPSVASTTATVSSGTAAIVLPGLNLKEKNGHKINKLIFDVSDIATNKVLDSQTITSDDVWKRYTDSKIAEMPEPQQYTDVIGRWSVSFDPSATSSNFVILIDGNLPYSAAGIDFNSVDISSKVHVYKSGKEIYTYTGAPSDWSSTVTMKRYARSIATTWDFIIWEADLSVGGSPICKFKSGQLAHPNKQLPVDNQSIINLNDRLYAVNGEVNITGINWDTYMIHVSLTKFPTLDVSSNNVLINIYGYVKLDTSDISTTTPVLIKSANSTISDIDKTDLILNGGSSNRTIKGYTGANGTFYPFDLIVITVAGKLPGESNFRELCATSFEVPKETEAASTPETSNFLGSYWMEMDKSNLYLYSDLTGATDPEFSKQCNIQVVSTGIINGVLDINSWSINGKLIDGLVGQTQFPQYSASNMTTGAAYIKADIKVTAPSGDIIFKSHEIFTNSLENDRGSKIGNVDVTLEDNSDNTRPDKYLQVLLRCNGNSGSAGEKIRKCTIDATINLLGPTGTILTVSRPAITYNEPNEWFITATDIPNENMPQWTHGYVSFKVMYGTTNLGANKINFVNPLFQGNASTNPGATAAEKGCLAGMADIQLNDEAHSIDIKVTCNSYSCSDADYMSKSVIDATLTIKGGTYEYTNESSTILTYDSGTESYNGSIVLPEADIYKWTTGQVGLTVIHTDGGMMPVGAFSIPIVNPLAEAVIIANTNKTKVNTAYSYQHDLCSYKMYTGYFQATLNLASGQGTSMKIMSQAEIISLIGRRPRRGDIFLCQNGNLPTNSSFVMNGWIDCETTDSLGNGAGMTLFSFANNVNYGFIISWVYLAYEPYPTTTTTTNENPPTDVVE